jgi:hypothetical protein
LPAGSEENHEISDMAASLRAEIWTRDSRTRDAYICMFKKKKHLNVLQGD